MIPIPESDGLPVTRWSGGLRPASPEDAGVDPLRLEQAFDVLRSEIAAGLLPGAVAVIARRGAAVAHRALGWRQLYPHRRPMEPDTLFDLASLTKVAATLPAVLTLLEQGAFRLDDPVCRFFPAFSGGGKEQVTVRHLLTHTGGLPADFPHQALTGDRAEDIARILAQPLQAEPGLQVIYSDLGFIILGEMVALLSGEPLDRYVRRAVHGPLGMHQTGFRPSAALRNRCAATEYRPHLGRWQCGEVHDEKAAALGGVAGHAGLFGTAADLAAYGQMWLSGGAGVLSPATVAVATRDQTAGLGEGRGLGWIVTRPGDTHLSCGDLFTPGSFGHTGFTGTSLWIEPARELVVVLLTNRVHLGRQDHILRLRPRFHNAVAAALR
ncbi:MAG TPA: serine hydrolase [Symbiobacteriaceae bacterium]